MKGRIAADRRRFEAGAAGDLWHRLQVLDVVNQSMLLAATLLICAFPFLIFLDLLRGRSFAGSVVRHMGLDADAAAQVQALFVPSPQSRAAVGIGTIAFLVLGAIAVAASVQALYARVFGFDPRDLHALWRRVVWLLVTIGGASAVAAIAAALAPVSHGGALAALVNLVVVTGFFWWGLRFLLEDRLAWRYLLPSGVATGLCWTGLALFSRTYFSPAIVSAGTGYGPIGVVFVIMTWLIAVGVVLALGAVVGVAWRERHPLRGVAP